MLEEDSNQSNRSPDSVRLPAAMKSPEPKGSPIRTRAPSSQRSRQSSLGVGNDMLFKVRGRGPAMGSSPLPVTKEPSLLNVKVEFK